MMQCYDVKVKVDTACSLHGQALFLDADSGKRPHDIGKAIVSLMEF